MEDKGRICELLLKALQETRNHGDMTELAYDEASETVTIRWLSGGKRVVNASMDSGTAMIRDIMRAID